MKKHKYFKEIISIIIPALVIYLLLTNFVFTSGTISGNSMSGTYEDGYKCFTFFYDKNNIQRFDTITYNNEGRLIIKRVIGLPNEKIEYKDNKLFINDKLVSEPFLKENVNTEDFICNLKDNEYFCMGDNRSNSKDSRTIGPILYENIIGTHLFVYFPFNKIGFYK